MKKVIWKSDQFELCDFAEGKNKATIFIVAWKYFITVETIFMDIYVCNQCQRNSGMIYSLDLFCNSCYFTSTGQQLLRLWNVTRYRSHILTLIFTIALENTSVITYKVVSQSLMKRHEH